MTPEKKIRYVGRRTIRKRGCFGCHDIPGLEDAVLIAPPLSDWGRKQTLLLAFEQIDRFLADKSAGSEATVKVAEPGETRGRGKADESDQAFYLEAVRSQRREGFLWQKLRAPRSFDYKKAERKSFGEQLLMGQFTLTEVQREAIITFVLGLTAETAGPKYVFQPNPRRKALVAGRKLLDQYGCAQCHTLEMERWTIDYDPARFPQPPTVEDYAFLKPEILPEQLAKSKKTDRRGLIRTDLVGMPQWSAQGKPEETEDEDGNPQFAFVPWEPAAIGGKVWPVGGASILVGREQIVAKRDPLGGDYARLLFPVVLANAKSADLTAGVSIGWGWVPPPLVHEGRVVQPAWLQEYLLEPYAIRPAVVLRMPKYDLSPSEAGQLADYFAAASRRSFRTLARWGGSGVISKRGNRFRQRRIRQPMSRNGGIGRWVS